VDEVWSEGEAYERFMGRWSAVAARSFLAWLAVDDGWRWLDVGCGAGDLTGAVVSSARPSRVVGVDRSTGFVTTARARTGGRNTAFVLGDATRLPLPDDDVDVDVDVDVVVSGLLLNFLPDPRSALAEFARVGREGGLVAGYVWSYSEGMPMLSHFWDAAAAVDPAAKDLDERSRFDLCHPRQLADTWEGSGLEDVAVQSLSVPMTFTDFDDLWAPFLGGQGPAPTYLMSLPEPRRADVREELRARLPVDHVGRIDLTARAWAVRGTI
jgi:SAM-dependent methyltransferase